MLKNEKEEKKNRLTVVRKNGTPLNHKRHAMEG